MNLCVPSARAAREQIIADVSSRAGVSPREIDRWTDESTRAPNEGLRRCASFAHAAAALAMVAAAVRSVVGQPARDL